VSVYPIFPARPRGLFFPPAVSRISLFEGKKMTRSPCKVLTNSSLVHLFRRKCEYGENLGHCPSEHRRHFHRGWNARINVETREERLDALEEIDEDTTTCGDVFGHLESMASEEQMIKKKQKRFTLRRTSIPVNITFAGENVCDRMFCEILIRREHIH
jgi:hypothetical protein